MPSMISLDGQFKADIYNQNDELVKAGEYSNNYITATGLCYPLTMPFGDCFASLSLGSGKAPNTLYTTGLQSGAAPWIYSPDGPGDYRAKCNFLWTTGVDESSCGYRTHLSGVEMYRAWRIPELPGSYVHQDITFNEMMTSPCTTGQFGFSGTTREVDQGQNAGFIDKHSGRTAFNRALHSFSLPSGDYSIVTYKLNFVIDKEIQTFSPFIALNSAAGGTKEAWQSLTGKARVMHPGIQIIPNFTTSEESEESEGGYERGGLVLTKKYDYGSPLEPSASGNIYAYFSTDNTQFRFDPFWGGQAKPALQRLKDSQGIYYWNPTGINLATGFAEYFHNMPDLMDAPDDQQGDECSEDGEAKSLHHLHSCPERLEKFRHFRREKSELPKSTDWTDEFKAAAMGNNGYDENVIVTSVNHDISVIYTGQIDQQRGRDLARILSWQGQNAIGDPGVPGTYIKYKSLVFCADGGVVHRTTISNSQLKDSQIYAFFDSQFGTYDSSNHPNNGQYLVNYTTGKFVGHQKTPYASNDDLPTFSQPPKDFPSQDNQNGLSVTWKLAWSSPCHDCAGSCSNNADPAFQLSKSACEAAGGSWTPCVDL